MPILTAIPFALRRHVGSIASFCLILAACSAAPAQSGPSLPSGLNREEIAEGWLSLFDGRTLFGWRIENDGANWEAVDGEIRVDRGPVGLLRTTSQFDDFELRFDFFFTDETNSGVFFRTRPRPSDPTGDCFEWNIASGPDQPFPTGSLVGRQKADRAIPPNAWHSARIRVDGPRVQSWIDGENVLDYTGETPSGRGYIGLQKNAGPARFRNLAILPLNQKSLMAEDAAGVWNRAGAGGSTWTLEPTEIRGRGGPGQLESVEHWQDFVLSWECSTAEAGVNSGLFFRCVPGEPMNGYEVQIENASANGEEVEAPTGSIFRRQNARAAMGRDQEWVPMTLVACGPHFSVWVNGFQVVDWTDQRPPDPNPRRGTRREGGSLMLQGHDPRTDVRFRAIRIRELDPRQRDPRS